MNTEHRQNEVRRSIKQVSAYAALPEDSWSLTVPAIARHFGLEHGPFPLTPTLSPRRGSLIVRAREHSVCSDRPRDGIGFSLSPRERVGVRGKGTLARHTLFAWGLTSGHRPSAHGFEPSPISSLRLCRRLLTVDDPLTRHPRVGPAPWSPRRLLGWILQPLQDLKPSFTLASCCVAGSP
jgi:hypothetical protein